MLSTHYKEFFANQEEPELLPNEVAGRMAELLGLDHYRVHQLLTDYNPPVGFSGESVTLAPADLARISTAIAQGE